MANKGTPFERAIAKQLSLWWTQDDPDGPHDGVFWRTSNSGGRATVRGRKGGKTTGQHGDLCATDPCGDPLMEVVSIELKRGYQKTTLHDLLDCLPGAAEQEFAGFIHKAERDAKAAGVPYWLLITRRDRRLPLVTAPVDFYGTLLQETRGECGSMLRMKWEGRLLVVMTLDQFLTMITPRYIQSLAKQIRLKETG